MRRICGAAAMGLLSPEPKDRHFLPKSQNEGSRIHCGKNHGKYKIGKAAS
jgi:hypothetical protein